MRTIELFAATGSFSRVMEKHGHETFTVDNDPQFDCDLTQSVLDPIVFPYQADILWASPPCETWSVASMGHHWGGGYRGYVPKTDAARTGKEIVLATFRIIEEQEPEYWFIENPQGVLKKMPFMHEFLERNGGRMVTVWYCHYGDTRAKPTNLWTNAPWFSPKPVCHNRNAKHPEDCCCRDHEAAPRGARTGTQGIGTYKDRSRIPSELFEEILSQMPI